MSFPVAVQLYSVRWDAEKDLRGTLEKIKEMGYDGVEFAGLYGSPPEVVGSYCREIGFTVSAMSRNELATRWGALPICRNRLQICGDSAPRTDAAAGFPNFPYVLGFIETIAKAAKVLGPVLYHNHDFEFIKLTAGTGLSLRQSPTSWVPSLTPAG